MAAEHDKQKTPDSKDEPSGSDDLKESWKKAAAAGKAEKDRRQFEYEHDLPSGTGSFDVLKHLHMSIVDGGVNILKRSFGELIRNTKQPQETREEKMSAAPHADTVHSNQADQGTADGASPSSSAASEVTEPRPSDTPSLQAIASSMDWIDQLMDSIGVNERRTLEAIIANRKTLSGRRPSDGVQSADISKTTEEQPGETIHVSTGITLHKNADGSQITTEIINGVACVIKITHPNGNTQEIRYGADREPSEWISNPGTTLKRRDDQTWIEIDNGLETVLTDVVVKVRPNGDILYLLKDGSLTESWNHNGTITRLEADYKLEFNENQKVVEIKYPDGLITRISYGIDEPHDPTSIIWSDGREWHRDGSTWYKYKDQALTGETEKGGFTVRENGDIVRHNSEGRKIETWRPNGSKTISSETRKVTKDENGNIRELTYPGRNGAGPSTYKFENGQLIEALTADGQLWQKAASRRHDVELIVLNNGDCAITKDGELLAIKHRDGCHTEVKWNGEREIKDRNGQVVEVVPAE